MTRRTRAALALGVVLSLGLRPFDFEPEAALPARIDVAADRDDDDENGVADAEDARPDPADLRSVWLRTGARAEVRVVGPIRVVVARTPLETPGVIRTPSGALRLDIQGVTPGEATLVVRDAAGVEHVTRVVVHGVDVEGPAGRLDPRHDALTVAHGIPNDAVFVADETIAEDAFRIRATSPEPTDSLGVRRVPQGDESRREGHVTAVAPSGAGDGTTVSLRVVASESDLDAPGVSGRLIRAALRDRLDVELRTPTGIVSQSWRVGRPPAEDGPLAARRLALRVTVVDDPASSIARTRPDAVDALVRRQIALTDEILAPCAVATQTVAFAHARAPTSAILAIGDDGLPASGGALRLRVDGVRLPPIPLVAGERPSAIAERVAAHVRAAGFEARVWSTRPSTRAAGPGADVFVRRRDGALASLEAEDDDRRLDVRVARVDLADGLMPFDDATAVRGSLEERGLLLPLRARDPHIVDVVVIERFARGARSGEAFIPRDRSPLAGTIVIDHRALALTDVAMTLAHELAHVLLDDPHHPEDVGRVSPFALLASRRARGGVRGARRLDASTCARLRASGEAFLERAEPP